MGAKYLCCLPLRLGVLLISFLQFIVSLAVAGILAAALVLNARGIYSFLLHKSFWVSQHYDRRLEG
jgi:hypothetical protein